MSTLKNTASQIRQKSGSGQLSTKNRVTSVNNVDAEFIAPIYNILRTIEKDPTDQGQRVKQSLSVSNQLEKLQKKFDLVRNQIKQLPGIELNKEDQLKNFENLRKNLNIKRELILKYRNMAAINNQ